MSRCCRSGEDVGARAASVSKGWASAQHLSMPCPHAPQDAARSEGRVHIVTAGIVGGSAVVFGVPWNERGVGPRGGHNPAGPRPVQLRYETGLTGEQYVTAQAWRDARLERCPNHPHGGCSLARHGTYARKTPPGAKVPRWYCRESHTTISLLADCLAARLAGTLDALASGGGCRRGGAEPGGGGERGAPPRGRWRRRASRRDALGAPPGAPRPSRREPRHRAPPRTACPVHRRGGRGAHTARDRLRAESAACPHRRAAPRTARSVGVPAPPSRGDESQPGAPTQEGA